MTPGDLPTPGDNSTGATSTTVGEALAPVEHVSPRALTLTPLGEAALRVPEQLLARHSIIGVCQVIP